MIVKSKMKNQRLREHAEVRFLTYTGYDKYIILFKKQTQEIATFGTFWFEVKNSIFELKWNLLNKTVASLT